MPVFASQVQQQIYQNQLMLAQQTQQANQLSQQMGLMPQFGLVSAAMSGPAGQGGIYGEQVAGRMLNAGRTAVGLGGLAMSLGGALGGMPMDPFSAAWSGGRAGFAMGGIAGGIGGAALGAAPFMMASQIAGVYTGAFGGGMREQVATNSMLRNNFQFQGGGGALGRGFSQGQMGQIGSVISQETRQSPFTSSRELNQLISSGSEAGMFEAVRDVETFSKRFRTMLDGLKKIQKELGGTLTDALSFSRGTQQLGIYTSNARSAFAVEMRDTMATTGMDQQQLFGLAAQGSMMSRATGGFGRQGAVGALRTARQLGAALQSGALSREVLSDATGGLQGDDAIQAFTSRVMQMSDRFSRSTRGRYSMFALANEEGTGLDPAALARFRAGDISVGGIMREAQGRVNRMGRAKALNREGILRGSMMEEGGMSGQIGMMKLLVGDRALEGGDDLAQLVMQRRMGLSRDEAQVWTGLMRNQGTIAQTETVERGMARDQMAKQRDITLHKSLESFTANFQHGLQDATGATRAKEMGRNFLTKISSFAERAMNDFLGVQASALTMPDRTSMMRVRMGMGTDEDLERLGTMAGAGSAFSSRRFSGRSSAADPFAQSSSGMMLEAMGMHGPLTLGQEFADRGIDFRSLNAGQRSLEMEARDAAQRGALEGPNAAGDRKGLELLMANKSEAMRAMSFGRMGGTDYKMIYGSKIGGQRVSANAWDAFSQREGLGLGAREAMTPIQQTDSVLRKAFGGRTTAEWAGKMALSGAAIGGALGLGFASVPLALVGASAGAAIGTGYGLMEAYGDSTATDADKARGFIARGGHLAKDWEDLDREGMSPEQAKKYMAQVKGGIFGGALSEESIQSVGEQETFKKGLRAINALRGKDRPGSVDLEIEKLRKWAGGLEGKERDAADVMVNQVEYNLKRQGGHVGDEYVNFLRDPERQRELDAYAKDNANLYRSMASSIAKEFPGRAAGKFRFGATSAEDSLAAPGQGLTGRLFEQASKAFAKGDLRGGQDFIRQATEKLSTLDPKSEEYQKIVAAIGDKEEGQAAIMMASQTHQAVREMTGGGRRGPRAQAESIFGRMTGFTLSEADIKTAGGKSVGDRNKASYLMRAISGGGKEGANAAKELEAYLKSSNVAKASEYVGDITKALADGKMSPAEATALNRKLSSDQRLREMQMQATEEQKRKLDPVGMDQLSELKNITKGITTLVSLSGGGDSKSHEAMGPPPPGKK